MLNAANEMAVAAFLTRHLTFLGITELVRDALDEWHAGSSDDDEGWGWEVS